MLRPHLTESTLPRLVAALLLLVAGCGGNVVVDGGGGVGGGAGGGDPKPPSQFGTPTAACKMNEGGFEICEQTFDASLGTQLAQSCAAGHFSSVSACPAAGVVGCCLVSAGGKSLEECFYSGVMVAQVKQICSTQGGRFATTP